MNQKRRGFQSHSGSQERVRTHLFFSSQAEHHTAKRKRRTHNKLHQLMHRKDEMVQTGPIEFEPDLWSGNQRIIHFGPLAQRDPYFYYYPKGWDILYPAHFGFFPYRATKFRGSSSAVCMGAFGGFFCIGGALMIFLGHFVISGPLPWFHNIYLRDPIQIAGPILFLFGVFLILIAAICSICSLKKPDGFYEKPPYQPLPPPAYPVLENKYIQSAVFNPQSEMKLYPPVMPGCSTLSLHGRSPSVYLGNPYNTLRAVSINRYHFILLITLTIAKERASSATVFRKRSSESSSAVDHRSKSLAPSQKIEKNRGRSQLP
ncbi:unnamed protein product [Dracunculus medinensis]|uniref:Uncharacterized protein n=1 Tax=Dracunculus medinensis TaxID=318479 RepID=A0A3P7Q4F1_DRAME|nr:unnamed protein product [Dracunculus medinensis]